LKCPIEGCDGQYKATGSRHSKRTGYWTRTRTCTKCGHKDVTIEISKDEFFNELDLLAGIDELIDAYHAKKKKTVEHID